MSDTGPILTIGPARAEVEMGSITPYESVNGRRYRVRYRKPDRTETQKRGFTTMREAKLYLSMVTVSKSKRSEEHTSELQSLMRISYAVFCLKKNTKR